MYHTLPNAGNALYAGARQLTFHDGGDEHHLDGVDDTTPPRIRPTDDNDEVGE